MENLKKNPVLWGILNCVGSAVLLLAVYYVLSLFGGKSFISSIVTKGEELLAAPIRFRVNGDDTNKFTTRLQESIEDEATYRISGKAGNLAVEADVRAEFD